MIEFKKNDENFQKKYQIFKKWSVFEEKTKFFWKNRDFSKVWNFPRICCNGNDIFWNCYPAKVLNGTWN